MVINTKAILPMDKMLFKIPTMLGPSVVKIMVAWNCDARYLRGINHFQHLGSILNFALKAHGGCITTENQTVRVLLEYVVLQRMKQDG